MPAPSAAEVGGEAGRGLGQRFDVAAQRHALIPRQPVGDLLDLGEHVLQAGRDGTQGLGTRVEAQIDREDREALCIQPPEAIHRCLVQHTHLRCPDFARLQNRPDLA